MLSYYDLARSCVAISYDTTTYADLKYNLRTGGVEVGRVDPDEFINLSPDPNPQKNGKN